MKVILLQNVPKLGQKGDIEEVSEGYARNMLFPRNLAKLADSGTIKSISLKKEIKDKKEEGRKRKVGEIFKKLSNTTITIKEKANENGHLFAQVHKKEIVDAAKGIGIEMKEDWIKLEHPIKEVGEVMIKISALGNEGKLKIEVVGE